jgi:histidinol-phosphate/aromatic aminotransferase/cobyric acid decarboxylase-like protein
VLRTLSKAHALAGARCGAAIASDEIIGVLGRVLPPYTFPTPVVESVLQALEGERAQRSAAAIEHIVLERARLCRTLEAHDCVDTIWPSEANFVLVRFRDLAAVQEFLRAENILIRDFSSYPALANCARITVGTAAENDALLAALRRFGE